MVQQSELKRLCVLDENRETLKKHCIAHISNPDNMWLPEQRANPEQTFQALVACKPGVTQDTFRGNYRLKEFIGFLRAEKLGRLPRYK